ncbi:MAG TPA: RNA-binding protein [Spirochaetota bacterium]|nr:RNA-binding protein [Spirochaetota bacterium]HPC41982.1 RNA-binding protein [Spirochaetota bacterium]HPL17242.1 RNA-binding protein [Spirochaetota bacterium]HQF06972.1 RNA-binding protein [Spirochaetota bacterium]HQH95709.1 RNA-binding protein [Spirochaetota bacterium]
MHGSKLFVGNISYSVGDQQLKELFAQHGTVVDIRIIGDKGFGFVEMSSQSEAENAKNALDGFNLDGRNLRVDEARPKGDKRSGGGGRGYR